jgi:hypothetical protein
MGSALRRLSGRSHVTIRGSLDGIPGKGRDRTGSDFRARTKSKARRASRLMATNLPLIGCG